MIIMQISKENVLDLNEVTKGISDNFRLFPD